MGNDKSKLVSSKVKSSNGNGNTTSTSHNIDQSSKIKQTVQRLEQRYG